MIALLLGNMLWSPVCLHIERHIERVQKVVGEILLGLGRTMVSSDSRVPRPPARITAFIRVLQFQRRNCRSNRPEPAAASPLNTCRRPPIAHLKKYQRREHFIAIWRSGLPDKVGMQHHSVRSPNGAASSHLAANRFQIIEEAK